MNERIQELRKQAMVSEAYYPAGNDGHPEYRSYLSEEKFAELIVRECGNIAFEHWALTHDTSPQESMLRHFGVEE